jgi:hypothetical protein
VAIFSSGAAYEAFRRILVDEQDADLYDPHDTVNLQRTREKGNATS